ncbi:MAG: LD-carboxypeptidase [Acidobacteria bacterium]|nr:LD-carboxypeptidase [Acidobacteriota bacterium]MCI0724121.1 LD-carboxypeptidase [Acidobacteriota bacterium]
MRKPKALREGSTIGIVAPASNVDREALLQGVLALEQAGYRVRYSDQVFSQEYYFAGTHDQRAGELTRLFADPGIEAIFCARGGYGCHHLLQRLNPEVLRGHPKIFLGYSDVTVLLQYLENQCEMVSFHGPMVAREFALGEPLYDRQNFLSCLTQRIGGHRIRSLGLETLRPGTARGRLTGGCLSLITATLGTEYEIQTEGKILFLEDISAKPYQIDRMLMHLKLARKLDKVRGVVFGEMLNCVQSADQGYRLQEIVLNTLSEYSFPILYGLPSGHTTTGSVTLPFGVEVTLNADAQYLELEEAAVE